MNLPSTHRTKLSCKSCGYKMQPTGFNISLGKAPPSTDARLATGASALEVWPRMLLPSPGRRREAPRDQMYKLKPVILVPSTVVWEP